MERPIVTPSHFYQHSTCPHWLWYDRFGDPARKGDMPELAKKLLDQGVVHEEEYVRTLPVTRVPAGPGSAYEETLALMRAGVDVIYQGSIETAFNGVVWRGKPDLLEKRTGASNFGNHFYVPVDIKSSHSIHKEHQLQLTFYAAILAELQGVRPRETAIVNIDHVRLPFRPSSAHMQKTKAKVAEIVEIMGGKKPPLRLASKCKHSPWFQECIRAAKEANDIALIYDLDQRSMPSLRAEGINTVADAARMDVDALPDIPYSPRAELDRVKLQAQALESDSLHWIARPDIPDAPLKIYFDIEGDPLMDVQYLFGFWIVPPAGSKRAGYYKYFLAETPEGEPAMWQEFLAWVETLPKGQYAVYHYADYERAQTLRMAEEYGSSTAFQEFVSRYVDLLKVVKASVIFPLYFYSIKDIAKSKFLNFSWRNKKAGGAQSIFWYEEWLESGDRRVLQDIVDYNEDDVVATERLHAWLLENGRENRPS